MFQGAGHRERWLWEVMNWHIDASLVRQQIAGNCITAENRAHQRDVKKLVRVLRRWLVRAPDVGLVIRAGALELSDCGSAVRLRSVGILQVNGRGGQTGKLAHFGDLLMCEVCGANFPGNGCGHGRPQRFDALRRRQSP